MPSWFGISTSSSHSRRPSYTRVHSSSSRAHSHRDRSPSGSSYYKRRPRDGFIARLISKLKHLFRELWYYFRRNPVKVFVFVIMPLISGGVLAGFARQFGIKLPSFLMGSAAARAGGGYYGSAGYGGAAQGLGGMAEGLGGLGGLGKMAMGMSGAGGLGSLMSIAKNFM